MQIDFIELGNFRKLHAARIDVGCRETLLVGANNSGKTSAMVALRLFLKERGGFSVRDITASNWAKLEEIAEGWLNLADNAPREPETMNVLLPAIDVWITIRDDEFHHVSHLIPNLDWISGRLGVRVRLEAKNFEQLVSDYQEARKKATDLTEAYKTDQASPPNDFSLWPKSFHDFLERRFSSVFNLSAYILDPEPHRVCRRLQLLSRMEHHEQDNEQIFTRSARTSRWYGFG